MMNKKAKILLFTICLLLLVIGCEKKKKHNWREVGNNLEETKHVTFGVQNKGGVTPSELEDSVPLVVIYVPLGNSKYEKKLYEADEISPESITDGLKYYGILDSDTTFSKYEEQEVDQDVEKELVGPGAKYPGEKKTKQGSVYLKDFASGYVAGADGVEIGEAYEKAHPNDSMGAMALYLDAASETYRENLGLLKCEILFD